MSAPLCFSGFHTTDGDHRLKFQTSLLDGVLDGGGLEFIGDLNLEFPEILTGLPHFTMMGCDVVHLIDATLAKCQK